MADPKLAFMKWHHRDYKLATGHLTPWQDLAYRRLLEHAWTMARCDLPDDVEHLVTVLGFKPWDSDGAFTEAVKSVLQEFWKLSRGRWTNGRLSREFKSALGTKTARVESGKKGGAAKARKTQEKNPSNCQPLPAYTRIARDSRLQTPDSEPTGSGPRARAPVQDPVETSPAAAPAGPPLAPPPPPPASPAAGDDWPEACNGTGKLVPGVCAAIGSSALDASREPGLITSGRILAGWRSGGASWALDVEPVLRRTTARMAATGQAIRSWALFDADVRAAMQDRASRAASIAAIGAPVVGPVDQDRRRAIALLDAFRDWHGPGARWPQTGHPVPGFDTLNRVIAEHGTERDRRALARHRALAEQLGEAA